MEFNTKWAVGLISILCLSSFQSGFSGVSKSLVDESPVSAKLVITNQFNGIESQDILQCEEPVHGYLTFSKKIVNVNELEAFWIRPDGSLLENFKTTLNFPAPGRQTAYVYLKFNNRNNGFLSVVNYERNTEYNGKWHVSVRLNGKSVAESDFQMKCS